MEEEEIMDMLGYSNEDERGLNQELTPSAYLNSAYTDTGDLNGDNFLPEESNATLATDDDEELLRSGHMVRTGSTPGSFEQDRKQLQGLEAGIADDGGEKYQSSATYASIPKEHVIVCLASNEDGVQEVFGESQFKPAAVRVDDSESSVVIEYLKKQGMWSAARELAKRADVALPEEGFEDGSVGDYAIALNANSNKPIPTPSAIPATQPGAQSVFSPLPGFSLRRVGRRQSNNQEEVESVPTTLTRRRLPRRYTEERHCSTTTRQSERRSHRSLPGAISMLGLANIVSENSINRPSGNENSGDVELAIPPPPPPLTHSTTIGSVDYQVRATAVDDIMTVEATQVDPEEISKAKHKLLFCVGAFGSVVATVILILSITLTRGNSGVETTERSASPTSNPTLTAESRLAMLREVVAQVSEKDLLYKADSAQYKALSWMANDYEGTDPEDDRDKVIQRYIMTLLFFHTNGSNWTEGFNFLSMDSECQWTDVVKACDEDGFLLVLKIPKNNMEGQFPVEITRLTRLQQLDLNTNQLTGTLPREIANMIKLYYINLMENRMENTLPTELYQLNALQSFLVSRNSFSGTIHSAIGQLLKLQYLHLGANFFTGLLPEELYNIEIMRELDIRQNNFTGTISEKIGNMKKLANVVLFANSCHGTLPSIFGSLRQLTNLQVSDLALTGTFPSELGLLTSLSRLALSYNRFVGTLPRDYARLSSLKNLYLQNNDFVDDVSFMCDTPLDSFHVDLREVNCTCCSCCIA